MDGVETARLRVAMITDMKRRFYIGWAVVLIGLTAFYEWMGIHWMAIYFGAHAVHAVLMAGRPRKASQDATTGVLGTQDDEYID